MWFVFCWLEQHPMVGAVACPAREGNQYTPWSEQTYAFSFFYRFMYKDNVNSELSTIVGAVACPAREFIGYLCGSGNPEPYDGWLSYRDKQ